jgi:pimeloyl-ACP methyl ester carboxylesterase
MLNSEKFQRPTFNIQNSEFRIHIMAITNANGVKTYYETYGDGPPLALISGLGYDHWQWHKMAPLLARDFRVIVYDNRGAGQSEKPAGPYTAHMLADDLADLLYKLGVKKAHVMGHSMGGFVAQAFALDYPEMVDKLILASTNFGGPNHVPITPEAMAVLTDTKSDPLERLRRGVAISTAPGFVEAHPEFLQEWINYRAVHPIDPTGYQAQLAIGLGLLSPAAAFENKLGNIKARTLVLSAEHDKVVPSANGGLMAGKIPGGMAITLARAGHFFPFEIPELASQTVAQFLKSR